MFQTSGEDSFTSLLDRFIYIMISHLKVCHTASKNSKIFSPQHKVGYGVNICETFWLHFLWYPNTINQTPFLWENTLLPNSRRKTVSFLRAYGQFLFNMYDNLFMSWTLPMRALWTKSRTFFSFIPLSLNITVGSWGFGLLEEVLEYHLVLPNMSSNSNIRYVSRVEWSNPGKGVAPFPTPRCSSYWKGRLLVAFDYGRQLCF